MTNGVISDFDEENFDESFCLPVKHTIILLLLLLHVLVTIIATLHQVYVHCTCLKHACLVPDKHAEGSGTLSFVILTLHRISLKYLSKDILALSLNCIQYALSHDPLTLQAEALKINFFNQMQNIVRENFDDEA